MNASTRFDRIAREPRSVVRSYLALPECEREGGRAATAAYAILLAAIRMVNETQTA